MISAINKTIYDVGCIVAALLLVAGIVRLLLSEDSPLATFESATNGQIAVTCIGLGFGWVIAMAIARHGGGINSEN